jgi:hypothetical protein
MIGSSDHAEDSIPSQIGTLINVYQDSHVEGTVQADNMEQVTIHPSTFVGGNIQIESSGGASITGVQVDSAIQFPSG